MTCGRASAPGGGRGARHGAAVRVRRLRGAGRSWRKWAKRTKRPPPPPTRGPPSASSTGHASTPGHGACAGCSPASGAERVDVKKPPPVDCRLAEEYKVFAPLLRRCPPAHTTLPLPSTSSPLPRTRPAHHVRRRCPCRWCVSASCFSPFPLRPSLPCSLRRASC